MTRSNYILSKISSFDVLNHYLKPYHNYSSLDKGKNISNPFLTAPQNTPSFNIHLCNKTGEWRYKDFATGDKGSCFDLVMKLFNLNFIEALNKIQSDFNIQNQNAMSESNYKPSEFSIKTESFNQSNTSYWEQFSINVETINKFNVKCVTEYTTTGKHGTPYTIKAKSNDPIFAYQGSGWTKLYRPLNSKYKFRYLGNKPSDYIFGLEQLPQNADLLFITGGEKDVLTLASQGYNAISLNSETASLNPLIAKQLRDRFNNVIVLYDTDETGHKQSEILSTKHGFYSMSLPQLPNNGKDISDYFKEGKTLGQLQEIIIQTLSQPAPKISENEQFINNIEEAEKVVYTALELVTMGSVEPKYLMAPILPQKGTAVLAGKPDTGKSQFARQLCLHVALSLPEFLNFKLTPIHNRSIYVATEDNLEATQYLLSKQLSGLAKPAEENLKFIFADTMEQEDILTTLNKELTTYPADLVVVDSFGDIFTGRDSNNNMAMRNTVKIFDAIAKKHNCLILFVHHINKGAYRQAPGQEHIQGGAGLVQKVRLAIQLTEGENNTRYFTVVKGNYCPKEYKKNSLDLEFSETTFLFTNTGKLIPTEELGSKEETNKKEEKYNDLLIAAIETFANHSFLTYSNFIKIYGEVANKSVPTAKRHIKTMVELEILIKKDDKYALNPDVTNPPLDSEDNEAEIEF